MDINKIIEQYKKKTEITHKSIYNIKKLLNGRYIWERKADDLEKKLNENIKTITEKIEAIIFKLKEIKKT